MTDSDIIDNFGGATKLAALLEISQSAVSQWRTNGIPKARLQFLKLYRPDLCRKKRAVATKKIRNS